MIGVFFLYAGAIIGVFAAIAAVADRYAEADDEDLAWVDREIDKVKNGARSIASEEPQMEAERREYLERLYRVRRRLVGET